MPLHAMKSVRGEAGLQERLAIEIAGLFGWPDLIGPGHGLGRIPEKWPRQPRPGHHDLGSSTKFPMNDESSVARFTRTSELSPDRTRAALRIPASRIRRAACPGRRTA